MNDYHSYCKQKASSSGSSFYYSFLFLSAKQKQAIIAVYAFCREVDDIVDESTSLEMAQTKLLFWQQEISRVFNGNPQHPVGLALKDAVQDYKLPQQPFEEIIQGMYMDLEYQGYQTFEDLKLYCYRVASTVGMLAAKIFGYRDNNTLEYARLLGLAFQLINIIRDVGEDAKRNRIYLPEEDLVKFSISTTDILTTCCEDDPNFKALMTYQANRARNIYHHSLRFLSPNDRPQQLCGLIMARIYFAILDEIEKTELKVLSQRTTIPTMKKLWLAWQTTRQEKKYANIG